MTKNGNIRGRVLVMDVHLLVIFSPDHIRSCLIYVPTKSNWIDEWPFFNFSVSCHGTYVCVLVVRYAHPFSADTPVYKYLEKCLDCFICFCVCVSNKKRIFKQKRVFLIQCKKC